VRQRGRAGNGWGRSLAAAGRTQKKENSMADMFLNLEGIDGESLDGEPTDKPLPNEPERVNHWKEIEIHDWFWKVDNAADYTLQPGTMEGSDQGKGWESSKVNVFSITIHKHCDRASVKLLQFCVQNTPILKARITCRKNQGDGKLEYLTIDLADVTIHSIDWKGMGQETVVSEDIVLEFAKFEVNYEMQRNPSDDRPTGKIPFGWDIQKHETTTVTPPPPKRRDT
jgi:type VI secretion system secreted protein Hcp